MIFRTEEVAEQDFERAGGEPSGGGSVGQQLFTTAWCAVGGNRGSEFVPRWFGVLPELGIRQAHLFWALPETADSATALDRIRSLSSRWMAGLQALGIEAELTIKRGTPGPWLAGAAGISPGSLVVVGPPSGSGSPSATVAYLLEEATTPVLFLPELHQPPEGRFLARPVVGLEPAAAIRPLLAQLLRGKDEPYLLDLRSSPPLEAIRTALRIAEDVDASLLVLPGEHSDLVPYALRHGSFPLLLSPPRDRMTPE